MHGFLCSANSSLRSVMARLAWLDGILSVAEQCTRLRGSCFGGFSQLILPLFILQLAFPVLLKLLTKKDKYIDRCNTDTSQLTG